MDRLRMWLRREEESATYITWAGIVVGLLLFGVLAHACSSSTLTREQRLADIQACAIAAAAAGIPLIQAVTDMGSTNAKKATDAQTSVREANALPACLKVGANAAVVVNEHLKPGAVPMKP